MTKAKQGTGRPVTSDTAMWFRVPATAEGRRFIKNVRRWMNRHDVERIRVLANGPRRAAMEKAKAEDPSRGYWSYNSNLPQRFATELRVYVDRDREQMRERMMKIYEMSNALTEAKRRATHAENGLATWAERARRDAESAEAALRIADRYAERLAAQDEMLASIPTWVRRLCDLCSDLRAGWRRLTQSAYF